MFYSVIIPLYNKAPYVTKAVQSVLSQTFADYELIVVDDGSDDNSGEIAMKALEGRDNCQLIRQENAGVSKARNNGVSASHGDYLCFLDADDWWNPSFLEEMAKLIDEYPDAGIYGTSYTIVNESKHKTRVAIIGVEEGFERGYINYCKVYARTMYMPLTSISVAMPRKVFDEMKGFPQGITLGEDFLLWIRIALKYKVVFLNRPLAYYNQDVESNQRGVGRLHKPEGHMLWNLMDLEPVERSNEDYKQLIDNLRTYILLPYYLSADYHEQARRELEKVDWKKQPEKVRRLFSLPLSWLRIKNGIERLGSQIKTGINRMF